MNQAEAYTVTTSSLPRASTRTTQPSGSPLFVWKLAFAVVLCVLVLMLLIDPRIIDSRRRAHIALQKIETVQPQNGHFRILFLGNSLLEVGLPDSEMLLRERTQAAVTETASPLQVMRFIVPGGSFYSLNKIKPAIYRLRPHIVVMQLEMIVKRKFKFKITRRLSYWSLAIHQAISDITLRDVDVLRRKKQKPEKLTTLPPVLEQRQKSSGFLHRIEWNPREHVSFKASDLLASRNFIAEAEAQGIHVFVVDAPFSESIARTLPAGYVEQRQTAVQSIFGERNRRYLQYSDPLPDHLFRSDRAHLNEEGRELFTTWLIQRLSEELQGRVERAAVTF